MDWVQDWEARHAWFKSVILPHESALRSRVRQLATTPEVDVEDIVSEALIRAYQAKDFTRIDRGRAFLFTIARHLLVDLARHRAVVPFDLVANLDVFDLTDPTASPESTVMVRDELRRLQKVIDALPAQCRRVLLMRRVDELSMADIAGQLGLSVSTVEKHLSKAIALMTRAMAEPDPPVKEKVGFSRLTWLRAKDRR